MTLHPCLNIAVTGGHSQLWPGESSSSSRAELRSSYLPWWPLLIPSRLSLLPPHKMDPVDTAVLPVLIWLGCCDRKVPGQNRETHIRQMFVSL